MLSDLAFGLVSRSFDVHVVTSRQRYDDPKAELPAQETIRGVQVIRVKTTSFGRRNTLGRLVDYLGFYASATWALFKLADRETIVIAKTDPPLISVPAAAICKLRGASLVNWLQDLFPEVATALGIPATKGMMGALLKRMRNWSLHAAHCNVAIGQRMQEQLIAQKIPAEKIKVIHNWADGSSIKPVQPEENPLRSEWNLQSKFVVGYSGNLGKAHEFETILAAAKLLESRQQNDVLFLFIGGGAQAEQVRKAAEKYGLSNVLFKPYQPRNLLHLSLGAADAHLVVLRPELEGLIVPSKFYGIAAAGRPVLFIGSPDGEVASLIASSESGAQIDPGDGEELAAAILRLKNAVHRKPTVRSLFESHFDFPIALSQWCQLLNSASDAAKSRV